MHFKRSSAKMAAILSNGRWVKHDAQANICNVMLLSAHTHIFIVTGRHDYSLSYWGFYFCVGGVPPIMKMDTNVCRSTFQARSIHYNDVTMGAMASQITSLTLVFPTLYSRHRSKKTSKLHVTGLWEGNSPVTGEFPPHKGPVTRKMFPFDDVIMWYYTLWYTGRGDISLHLVSSLNGFSWYLIFADANNTSFHGIVSVRGSLTAPNRRCGNVNQFLKQIVLKITYNGHTIPEFTTARQLIYGAGQF